MKRRQFLATLALSLVAAAAPSWGAPAFDAVSCIGADTDSNTGDLSWTHTPVGTPRGVIVLVAQNVANGDEVDGVTYGGAIYWHERGASADGSALSWHIETADTYLDENFAVLVRQLWPDITGAGGAQQGAVNLTLTSRYHPQGDTVTYGAYAMTPSQDSVDFKASGRLFRVKFSGSSAPTSARLGRMSFDVKLRGRK